MEQRHFSPRDFSMFLVLFSGIACWVVSLLMMWHATKQMLEVLNYIAELAQM